MAGDRLGLTPPAVSDALVDPALAGPTREVFLCCLHHLDVARHRALKVEGIAVSLTLRRATVIRALGRLVELGYLDRGARVGALWSYRLVWARARDGQITPAA